MNILLVDDDEDIRELLALLLSSQGHQVEQAVDGLDALARLREGKGTSLVLLDLMMPRLDGEGFMKIVKNDPRLARIPVWIISGHSVAREKASQLGAAGCLVKPAGIEELSRAIQSVTPGDEAPS